MIISTSLWRLSMYTYNQIIMISSSLQTELSYESQTMMVNQFSFMYILIFLNTFLSHSLPPPLSLPPSHSLTLSLSLSLSLSTPPPPFPIGRANCFSTATFACSGIPDAQRFGLTAGQQCCDDGFLAFIIAGENICTTCPSKLNNL